MKKEVRVEIYQIQKKIKINEHFIEKKVKEIKKFISPPPEKIAIYFVSSRKIRELNRKFMNKNDFTDVLTFKYSKNYGEIIISVEECLKNSKIYSNTLEEEILYVIIHGFLHLKGYRDYKEEEKKKMVEKQNKIFRTIISRNEKK
ncbi:MAG: rRNA maturation RNase YbeY [Candidatus Omnitrophica bacterium]|nr:rRNA maturation RNase YbeY [Candidatus Omnitrophota bacterium]